MTLTSQIIMPEPSSARVKKILKAIQEAQAEVDKGFRSNELLSYVRPHLHIKQQWFLSMDQQEILYGGAAGGGKSDALLAAALQYIDVPGYAAILFRRTYADLALAGALMSRANTWLSNTIMKKHDGGRKWSYPGGGTIEFGYLADDGDWERYQSAEFQFCTTANTKLLMGDGTYLTISQIHPGDLIATPTGSRKLISKTDRKKSPCVKVISPFDEQIQTIDHHILLADGKFYSYASLQCLNELSSSKQSHGTHNTSLQTELKSDVLLQTPVIQSEGHWPLSRLTYKVTDPEDLLDFFVWLRDVGIEDVTSCGELLKQWKPGALFVLAMLVSPDPQSMPSVHCNLDHSCATCDVRESSSVLSSLTDCRNDSDFCDGQSPSISNNVRDAFPSLNDVGTQTRYSYGSEDVQDNTPQCIRRHSLRYIHPYTKEIQNSSWVYQLSPCLILPDEDYETVSLTIESASVYVTSSKFVNRNCGYDELTQMPELAYTYLFSRLRKPAPHCPLCFKSDIDAKSGRKPQSDCRICVGTGYNPLHSVPIRMRAATNPGGVYGEWVKEHFIPKSYLMADEETQFSNVWVKRGMCIVCQGMGTIEIRGLPVTCTTCNGSGKTERYFLPARLEDNPSIDTTAYERSLAMLPEQQRAQLRHGRWDFMSDGTLFLREWFREFSWKGEHIELKTNSGNRLIDRTRFIRFITADTAAKTKTTNDYTVICVWALCHPNCELCLLDVFRGKILVPEILPQILEMRTKWNAEFAIVEEASSGIAIIQEAMTTQRGHGITILPYNPHGSDKVARSHEAQIRMRNEQIFFPDSLTSVVSECLNELLLFYNPDSHDDFVDNVTMAAWYAAGRWRKSGEAGKPGLMIRKGVQPVYHRFRSY